MPRTRVLALLAADDVGRSPAPSAAESVRVPDGHARFLVLER